MYLLDSLADDMSSTSQRGGGSPDSGAVEEENWSTDDFDESPSPNRKTSSAGEESPSQCQDDSTLTETTCGTPSPKRDLETFDESEFEQVW